MFICTCRVLYILFHILAYIPLYKCYLTCSLISGYVIPICFCALPSVDYVKQMPIPYIPSKQSLLTVFKTLDDISKKYSRNSLSRLCEELNLYECCISTTCLETSPNISLEVYN